MYKILFGFLFCFLFVKINACAQTYIFKYRIVSDTSFINHPAEIGTLQEHIIQSFSRKSFFDSTLIVIVANKDESLEEVIPKFLQTREILPGEMIPSSVIIGRDSAAFSKDMNETMNFKLDSSAFNNKYLLDKQKKMRFRIQPYPELHITCQNVAKGYKFRKTTIKKQIGKWNCYKWVPTEKIIKNRVSIWVCDTIPACVNVSYIDNNQFTGGVVCIDFNRGFSYNLIDYSKSDNSDFAFPELDTCDSTLTNDYNFIDELIYGKIGLDFKYEYKQ